MVRYVPDFSISARENEKNKRKIGIRFVEKMPENFTHFLFVDVDEFYTANQFKYAKELIVDKGYESTACKVFTYYKRPIWQISPTGEFFVPFIHKLKGPDWVGHAPYGVKDNVDPTRSYCPANFYEFTSGELAMHHFSYCRRDIAKKLRNSSAKNDENFKHDDKVVEQFDSFEIGSKVPLINKNFQDIEIVPDIFNLSYLF